MDLPTSYGTRLLSPFVDTWFALDWLPIIDLYVWALLGIGFAGGVAAATVATDHRARRAGRHRLFLRRAGGRARSGAERCGTVARGRHAVAMRERADADAPSRPSSRPPMPGPAGACRRRPPDVLLAVHLAPDPAAVRRVRAPRRHAWAAARARRSSCRRRTTTGSREPGGRRRAAHSSASRGSPPRARPRCPTEPVASARWTCAFWARRHAASSPTRRSAPFVMTIEIAGDGAVRSERLGN